MTLLIPAKIAQHSSHIHIFMKTLVRLTALMIPIGVGYWRHVDHLYAPHWTYFATGVLLSSPFSIGLVLSTFKFGRKIRWLTLFLILISAILHVGFVGYYGNTVFGLVVLTELYAIYSLFKKESSK